MADSRVKDLNLLTSIDVSLDSFLVEDDNANETKRTTLTYIKSALGLTGTNSGDQNVFTSIAVSGQSTVTAGTTSDTVTFVAGSNITITTNAGTKTVTINSTAAGVTDGDKGDITVSGGGATWTIDAGAVSYSKIQNVSATSRVLGRKTAGAGVIEEMTAGEVLDFIGTTQGSILVRTSTGWAELPPGTSGEFLRTNGAGANPSWAAPSASATWGSITGTLSSQTDLQSALNAKITAFADPNADRIVFWDDSAGAFAALTASTGLTISGTSMTVRSASATQTGIVELATDAETATGTDTARAVTPAGLASVGYVTASSSATFTNKTFDANGTGNSISNLEVADFAGSAIVTVAETIAANNNDTTIPTSAAVKAYADSVAGAGLSDGDKGDITVTSSGTVWTIDSDAVTYDKMQNISATSRVLGRANAGAGDPEELTASQVLDFIGTTQGVILFRGSGGWSALAPGSSGTVLTSNGSGADPSWNTISGGGGLTNFTEAYSSSTQSTSSLTATNAASNVNAALVAKGTGATIAQVPDGAVGAGNSRGIYATDWQKLRAVNTDVASGAYSTISGGRNNRATASDSTVVGGQGNVVGGQWTVVGGFGNTIGTSASSTAVFGESHTINSSVSFAAGAEHNFNINGLYSFAVGRRNHVQSTGSYNALFGWSARGDSVGQMAHSSGPFSGTGVGTGEAQRSDNVIKNAITGTAIAELFTTAPASAGRVLIPSNRTFNVTVRIVAVTHTVGNGTGTLGDSFIGEYACCIKNIAGTTSMVGTVQTMYTPQSDTSMSSCVVTITADNTNKTVKVEFTPPSTAGSTTVTRVVAHVALVEVSF